MLLLEDGFYVNGVNASTGTLLEEPLSYDEVASFSLGERTDASRARALEGRNRRGEKTWGAIKGVDERDLKQAGWGVIFPAGTDPGVKEALNPLIEMRNQQTDGLCCVYDDYQPGETWESYQRRHKIRNGLADPKQMPYYILLAGDPEIIPYTFQVDLGLERAAGRVALLTVEEYARYAEGVVKAETGAFQLPRRATVFATHNPGDHSTALSSEYLAVPIYQALHTEMGAEWEIGYVGPGEAAKPRLSTLLGGAETPALLFTATHGAAFSMRDKRFPKHQGALVTQEWPGPSEMEPLEEDHYFSVDDLSCDGSVGGMLAFFFACFSAGTPQASDFVHHRQRTPRLRLELSNKPRLSSLPMSLLSHPGGGSLAVVGHVDRAWDASFRMIDENGTIVPDHGALLAVLRALMVGYPLGSAMEEMSARYAQFSTRLTYQIYELMRKGLDPNEATKRELASLWTANNDARNFIILGDPAVRLVSPESRPGFSPSDRK